MASHRTQIALLTSFVLTLTFTPARAQSTPDSKSADCECVAAQPRQRGVGLELNVLWPFFPGGITELRLLVPVLRPDRDDFHGELVLGAYADFASRVVRDEEDGKVRNLSGKLGYRQFFVEGLHLEVSSNVGWRNEVQRPDGESYDAFHARLWLLAGYQHEFSPRFYANTRFGLGIHLYRSDRFASEEKQLVPGGDLNLGVRF